jgi:hypothetical protein
MYLEPYFSLKGLKMEIIEDLIKKALFKFQWLNNLSIAVYDRERKSIIKMIYEILHLAFIFKRFPVHYFGSLIYKKRSENYLDYLDLKEMEVIQEKLADKTIIDILDNKLFFHKYFSMTNIMLPQLLGYNFRTAAFIGRDILGEKFDLNDIYSLKVFINKMVSMSESGSLFINL